MRRLLEIWGHELKVNFKRPSYLVLTFGLPALAVVMVVLWMLFKGDPKDSQDPFKDLPELPVGYVDETGLFENPGRFYIYLQAFPTQDKAREETLAGNITGYYLIPADYIETGQLTRYSTDFSLIEMDTQLIESFLLNGLLDKANPLLMARIQSPIQVIEHQLDATGELVTEIDGDGFTNFGLVYMFSLIMALSTIMGSGQLMRSVITEKETRMIEIVLSSLRPIELMTGKVLGNGTAGLIQILCWLGAIVAMISITDANLPLLGAIELPRSTFFLMVLYFLGGYLLFAAFSSAIGAVSANMKEGPQYAIAYTLPAALPFFFLSNILEAPNGPLAIALSLFPLCSPLGMIERIVISSVPVAQIALSLIILIVTIVGALWLAARLFRVNTLLSGQKPDRQLIVNTILHG